MAEEEKYYCSFCREDKKILEVIGPDRKYKVFRTEENLLYRVVIEPINGVLCKSCGKAMLDSIRDSKALWKENTLVGT